MSLAGYAPMRILSVIDQMREEIVQLTQTLVRIPSVNCPPRGNEQECQQVIARHWEGFGLEVDVFEPDEVDGIRGHPAYLDGRDYTNRPNVVGIHRGAGTGRSLLVVSHADVVPPGPAEQWRAGPWSGELRDGKIYGRGSSDDKSGIAIQTMALEAILRAGFRLEGSVYLASVVDEEYGGANGTLACILRGYGADGGLMIDGSLGEIQIANLGGARFRIVVECQPSEHSHANSAMESMVNLCRALLEWGGGRQQRLSSHPLYQGTPFAAAGIKLTSCVVGGQDGTIAAPRAEVRGSFNTLPAESAAEVASDLQNHVRQAAVVSGCRVNVSCYGRLLEGSEIDPGEPIIQVARESHERVMGYPARITGFGGCDLFILNRHGSTPAAMVGAQSWGQPEGPHQANESVSIDQGLVPLTKIVALTMLQWCGCRC